MPPVRAPTPSRAPTTASRPRTVRHARVGIFARLLHDRGRRHQVLLQHRQQRLEARRELCGAGCLKAWRQGAVRAKRSEGRLIGWCGGPGRCAAAPAWLVWVARQVCRSARTQEEVGQQHRAPPSAHVPVRAQRCTQERVCECAQLRHAPGGSAAAPAAPLPANAGRRDRLSSALNLACRSPTRCAAGSSTLCCACMGAPAWVASECLRCAPFGSCRAGRRMRILRHTRWLMRAQSGALRGAQRQACG